MRTRTRRGNETTKNVEVDETVSDKYNHMKKRMNMKTRTRTKNKIK